MSEEVNHMKDVQRVAGEFMSLWEKETCVQETKVGMIEEIIELTFHF